MKHTTWSSRLSVSADGTGVVAYAGSVAVRLLADRTGLTKELGKATARRSFAPVHDRGQVLVDVAVMLADGGEAIGDIKRVAPPRPGVGAGGLGADSVACPGRVDSGGVEADRSGPGQGPPARVGTAAQAANLTGR